jgi:hypothetical protein
VPCSFFLKKVVDFRVRLCAAGLTCCRHLADFARLGFLSIPATSGTDLVSGELPLPLPSLNNRMIRAREKQACFGAFAAID